MKLFLYATFAAFCLMLTSAGCDGTHDNTVTPVGGNDGVDVDIDGEQPDGTGGVRVNVDDGRVDVDVDGDRLDTRVERREQRRERIGDALENVNVDVDAGGVQVDAN